MIFFSNFSRNSCRDSQWRSITIPLLIHEVASNNCFKNLSRCNVPPRTVQGTFPRSPPGVPPTIPPVTPIDLLTENLSKMFQGFTKFSQRFRLWISLEFDQLNASENLPEKKPGIIPEIPLQVFFQKFILKSHLEFLKEWCHQELF